MTIESDFLSDTEKDSERLAASMQSKPVSVKDAVRALMQKIVKKSSWEENTRSITPKIQIHDLES